MTTHRDNRVFLWCLSLFCVVIVVQRKMHLCLLLCVFFLALFFSPFLWHTHTHISTNWSRRWPTRIFDVLQTNYKNMNHVLHIRTKKNPKKCIYRFLLCCFSLGFFLQNFLQGFFLLCLEFKWKKNRNHSARLPLFSEYACVWVCTFR